MVWIRRLTEEDIRPSSTCLREEQKSLRIIILKLKRVTVYVIGHSSKSTYLHLYFSNKWPEHIEYSDVFSVRCRSVYNDCVSSCYIDCLGSRSLRDCYKLTPSSSAPCATKGLRDDDGRMKGNQRTRLLLLRRVIQRAWWQRVLGSRNGAGINPSTRERNESDPEEGSR
ncbi:hypothetical protein V1478_018774 [Vespula squamosa]|uniref:Uncharacterized protein n=1 Tax=Vespula squamosa TaxID=30214 RepID=A0ABD1ZTR2_VESSQ